MASTNFGQLPSNASTATIKPFSLSIPDSDIQHMIDLLKLTPVASASYENSLADGDRRLGLRRDWLVDAKKYWETQFDWRKHETFINSFPQFKASISDSRGDFSIHFAALFSNRSDAVPILMLHGWPGSFLEFLPILNLLRTKYTPDTLPYHVVVPSLPGYTLSSPQPVDQDLTAPDAARIMDSLAKMLGFEKRYVVQGGDVGSRVARIMGAKHPSCKAVHLNFCGMPEPESPKGELSAIEKQGLVRLEQWRQTGTAYAMEQGTRPSTIGFVLASNPLALLAWVGEKFLDWTDTDPSIDTIVEAASLYWLTRSAHTSLWSYRHAYGPNAKGHNDPEGHIPASVSFGYSYFPRELIPIPVAWVATTVDDMVFNRIHERGGHFAALEEPELLWGDVEEFVAVVKRREGWSD